MGLECSATVEQGVSRVRKRSGDGTAGGRTETDAPAPSLEDSGAPPSDRLPTVPTAGEEEGSANLECKSTDNGLCEAGRLENDAVSNASSGGLTDRPAQSTSPSEVAGLEEGEDEGSCADHDLGADKMRCRKRQGRVMGDPMDLQHIEGKQRARPGEGGGAHADTEVYVAARPVIASVSVQ